MLSGHLDELEGELRRLGRDRLVARLRDGLARETVVSALEDAHVVAPEALIALYEWHDGTELHCGETIGDLSVFPGFYFPPLRSLTLLVMTIVAAFRSGALFVEGGYLEVDEPGYAAIARRLNPGVAYWH